MNVQVGNKILVPEYGGTKLTLDEKVITIDHSMLNNAFIHSITHSCNNSFTRSFNNSFIQHLIPILQEYHLFRDGDILGVFENN